MKKVKKADNKLYIKSLNNVISELERIIEKFDKRVLKEVETLQRHFDATTEYSSEDEIQEHYGYGWINKKQYYKFLELFRAGKSALENPKLTSNKQTSNILKNLQKELMAERDELEFQTLSKNEREEILASRYGWQEKMQKVKDKSYSN